MLPGVKMCDEQISTIKDIKASIFTSTVMINHVSVMCGTHIMNQGLKLTLIPRSDFCSYFRNHGAKVTVTGAIS